MSTVPALTLNTGREIPQLGFGTYQVEPDECVETVGRALDVGYRHVDTAQMYGNEAEVGEAVRRSDVAREDLFLTSKLNNTHHARDDVLRTFDATLQALGVDELDLFLIHWPLPTVEGIDYVETWRALAELHRDGRLRSAGVSNFEVEHLERLAAETDLVPAVDQVEAHPFFANDEVRSYCREHGIVVEAWSPLAQGDVVDDPTIQQVAERVGRTAGQVSLRWHLQRGDVVFPKSTTPSRIEENFGVFDFELDDDAMGELDGLDRGEDGRHGPHPATMDFMPG